jgi:hypothetical protein
VNVEGTLVLANAHTEGSVFLSSAKIEGDFTCTNARFHVDSGIALDLGSAEITRSWRCSGASVLAEKSPDQSLFAESSRIGGDVFLRAGFTTYGVKLSGATIKGHLDMHSAVLGGFTAEEIHVDGSLNLNRSALSGVDLVAATVGSLSFEEAEIHPGSINLMNTKVERELNLTNLKVLPLKPAGENPWALDLTQATVGYLVDDSESWPDKGQLLLDGFVYGRFQGDRTPKTASQRLDWIRRQLRPEMPTWRERAHVFATQPYLQLAKVLREAGDDSGATQVLIGMERDRHRYGEYSGWRVLWPFYRLWGWILDATVGYGTGPGRAWYPACCLWLLARSSSGLAMGTAQSPPTTPYPTR